MGDLASLFIPPFISHPWIFTDKTESLKSKLAYKQKEPNDDVSSCQWQILSVSI